MKSSCHKSWNTTKPTTNHHQPRHTNHKHSFGQTNSHMRYHVIFVVPNNLLITWGKFYRFPSPVIVLSSTITLLGEKQWMPPTPSFTVFPCHQWGWQVGKAFRKTANHKTTTFCLFMLSAEKQKAFLATSSGTFLKKLTPGRLFLTGPHLYLVQYEALLPWT